MKTKAELTEVCIQFVYRLSGRVRIVQTQFRPRLRVIWGHKPLPLPLPLPLPSPSHKYCPYCRSADPDFSARGQGDDRNVRRLEPVPAQKLTHEPSLQLPDLDPSSSPSTGTSSSPLTGTSSSGATSACNHWRLISCAGNEWR